MMEAVAAPSAKIHGGRPPSTTRERIAEVSLELFARQGFERTTVEEIAREVGVGRRTIFRYYPSKNDLAWGNFDRVVEKMRSALAEAPAEVPMMEALRAAVLASNAYGESQLAGLRMRTTLITRNPVLQGHATIRYAAWRRAIAEFAAARLDSHQDDLLPQVVAHAALGTAIAAFTRWVRTPDADLEGCLDEAFGELARGFAGPAIIRSG
jgi:TetR/AcrR family transcriptional regulator, regulator of mycofactocin system